MNPRSSHLSRVDVNVAQHPAKLNRVGADQGLLGAVKGGTARLDTVLVLVHLAGDLVDVGGCNTRNLDVDALQLQSADVEVVVSELSEGDRDGGLSSAVTEALEGDDIGNGHVGVSGGRLSRCSGCKGSGGSGEDGSEMHDAGDGMRRIGGQW